MPTSKKEPAKSGTASPKASAAKSTPHSAKAAPKTSAKTHHTDSPVDHVAASALKLVDEAAHLLRQGITVGAESTEKARAAARKKALTLVNQAATQLTTSIDSGATSLRRLLKP